MGTSKSGLSRVPKTPQEAKEWCIEYATGRAQGNTLTAYLGPGFTASLACLDADHADFRNNYTNAQAGTIEIALNFANKDFEHGSFAKEVMVWIHDPARLDMKIATEKLMVEELHDGNVRDFEGLGFAAKVC